jgi:hypothetical protein
MRLAFCWEWFYTKVTATLNAVVICESRGHEAKVLDRITERLPLCCRKAGHHYRHDSSFCERFFAMINSHN